MPTDPFYQVLKDAQDQLLHLRSYIDAGSRLQSSDLTEIIAEIEETIGDLKDSITVFSQDPLASKAELAKREQQIQDLKAQLAAMKQTCASSPPLEHEVRDSASIDQSNALQEQILLEQDSHLDAIHTTMQNLHLQATTMGQEFEDQSFILQDLEGGLDSVRSKISRGTQRLQSIYERNSNSYNDCCITVLIALLVILLVLAFIA
ncbi:HFL185Cp [Eremothecium sinecaudum]|uniref:HFL185Cp n=1 Tax=Eremothecium sinecaudum TaxID=45286 RepID=A0A0X8HTR4_9SACH|nr:HFL185Cp [Eremothecium sinecaudum]AMD21671.1 HFL185Cp [Eremothecium sinecaudum]